MKLKDQFRFVFQNMKKNKTRIFMTILATAMGCAFLIVLASVGFGLHKSIVKDLTEQRMVTQIDVHGKEVENGFESVTDKDIQYFESVENVKAVTRRQMLHQNATYKLGDYLGYGQSVVTHYPSEIKAGFELSNGRLPKNSDEVVVGYDFLMSLVPKDLDSSKLYDDKGNVKEVYRYQDQIIGKKVELTVKQIVDGKEQTEAISLTVVGIGKKPTKEWVNDQNVFISQKTLKQIEKFTGTPRGMINDPSGEQLPVENIRAYDEVKLYATNVEAVEDINKTLEKQDYATYSIVNEMKQVNMLFTIMKAGLIFIGTIAILIASIGIYNTMTMAVTERAPDIGIMKAIGANPKIIKKIFLLESSYIGIVGAVFGTLVSYGISFAVNGALPLILEKVFDEKLPEGLMFSYIPWTLPLICIVICLGVTILSGMRPAKRATKIDVLKAMRREV